MLVERQQFTIKRCTRVELPTSVLGLEARASLSDLIEKRGITLAPRQKERGKYTNPDSARTENRRVPLIIDRHPDMWRTVRGNSFARGGLLGI